MEAMASSAAEAAPGNNCDMLPTAIAPLPSPKKKPLPKRIIRTAAQIPASILSDPALNAAISLLPSNYNFEVHKSVHRARSLSARRIALQFPDGLLMYSLPLSDILRTFAGAEEVFILAEPTYGACCIDDHAAAAVCADLLIHYGHSCLVPVSESKVPTLYVFVDIRIDAQHLISTVKVNFGKDTKLALAGTVQFNSAVHTARLALAEAGYDILVPQVKPLSAGEVLGCTAPKVGKEIEAVVFVADGRFHLEAFMIANPSVRAYRYDPYVGVMFLEQYDQAGMRSVRKDAILRARKAKSWGIVLGTLGRQGSTKLLDRVIDKIETKGLDYTVVLISELSPARIELFGDSVDAWVQIACPRLSIDWGEGFKKPVLTTFELEVALGYVMGWWERKKFVPETNGLSCINGGKHGCGSNNCAGGPSDCSCECINKVSEEEELDYPMDYYAQEGGEWNSTYARRKQTEVGGKTAPRMQTGVENAKG